MLAVSMFCDMGCTASANREKEVAERDSISPGDQLMYTVTPEGDTIVLQLAPEYRKGPLTDEDYKEVAEELGVETAAIKAIVEVETGKNHIGFWAENKPVINFDLAMFRRAAANNKVSLGKYLRSHSVVFSRPNAARYGSQQAAQQARLDAARQIHNLSAIQGTFWGMFQIGGFNWKKCGAESPDQFVELMSRSERDQLELFATFIRNSGMLNMLRNKQWAAFARSYNGPGYAARGYHTKMAAAYNRIKRQEAVEAAEQNSTSATSSAKSATPSKGKTKTSAKTSNAKTTASQAKTISKKSAAKAGASKKPAAKKSK